MQMTRNLKSDRRLKMKAMAKKGGRHNLEEDDTSDEEPLSIDEAEHTSDEDDDDSDEDDEDEDEGL